MKIIWFNSVILQLAKRLKILYTEFQGVEGAHKSRRKWLVYANLCAPSERIPITNSQRSTMGRPRLYHSPEEKALAVRASKENSYLRYTCFQSAFSMLTIRA